MIWLRRLGPSSAAVLVLLTAADARGDAACRMLTYQFKPVPFDAQHDIMYKGEGVFEERGPQFAIWMETAPPSGAPPAQRGSYVSEILISARTASFGIGNRPGNGFFASSPQFPYGARDFVLPVWAFAHGHSYPALVMQDGNQNSYGYHEASSTPENFFCRPMTPSEVLMQVDAVTCPSRNFSTDKGIHDGSGRTSLYPPRHDVAPTQCCVIGSSSCGTPRDSTDCPMLQGWDDIAAVSAATPNPNTLSAPYGGMWQVPANLPDGDYYVFLEVNKQYDNDAPQCPSGSSADCPSYAPICDRNSKFCTRHMIVLDDMQLNAWGYENNLGQPSTVWATRVTVDSNGVHTAVTDNYIGYGPWDCANDRPCDGNNDPAWNRGIHPPDGSISMTSGSGGARLAEISDGDGTWRFKVTSSPCGSCEAVLAPPAIDDLAVTAPNGDIIQIDFSQVGFGNMPVMQYQIKYMLGDKMTETDFETANPGPMVTPDTPGKHVEVTLGEHEGILPQRTYVIGVRAVGPCMKSGPLRVQQITTPRQKFATIEGCFIATAAFGSELEPEVATLRRFRDRLLLPSPWGRAFVRLYYGTSPPLARMLRKSDPLRAEVRDLLRPLVGFAHAALSFAR